MECFPLNARRVVALTDTSVEHPPVLAAQCGMESPGGGRGRTAAAKCPGDVRNAPRHCRIWFSSRRQLCGGGGPVPRWGRMIGDGWGSPSCCIRIFRFVSVSFSEFSFTCSSLEAEATEELFISDSRVVFWPPGQLTSRLGKYGIPQCPQHLLDRLVPQSSSPSIQLHTIILI